LKPFVRDESLPGIQVTTDDELLGYARRNGGTCYSRQLHLNDGFAPDERRRQ
jgi:hypothetical protein